MEPDVTWRAVWRYLEKRWYPGDPFQADQAARRYYGVKYTLALQLRPTSIIEIGVRAGYSAFSFLSAVPDADYLGIDDGLCDREAGARYLEHARGVLGQFPGVAFLLMNSQLLTRLPRLALDRAFEFAHVDADHSRAGCLHDIELVAAGARWILVDDYDVGAEIRAACAYFMGAHLEWHGRHVADGLRGAFLLTRLA